MSGFEVVQADMRSAATSIDSAGDGVLGADPSGKVAEVASAMPGSSSAGKASGLSTTWSKRFADWANDAEGQAERLRAAATDYDNSDYLADVRLRQLMHRTGEPGY